MKKILFGMALALSLTGCGVEDNSVTTTDPKGNPVTVQEGLVSETGVASFREAEPNASGAVAPGCWVVLDYCNNPNGGGATCHFTNCTLERAVDACLDLIADNC
ncbi:hypothetical protein [Hyalangium gracile]|uniref:hypothetical protein n=1 Tax=Hyalangium gracile TaxID=394092 RepID=UPI001CCFBF45|nr:hypothetical protein [Hyalangium gracile]